MEDIYEYPLKQHLGEQVVPVVVDGDSVNRGQLVAFQRENTLGANLYSSVKGVVTKVTEQSIFIKAVGEQTADYEPLKGSEPLELIRDWLDWAEPDFQPTQNFPNRLNTAAQ